MAELKLLVTSMALVTMAACNTSPTQNSALDTKKTDSDSTFNICYSSIVKRDTILLNAHVSGDSVRGSLGYKLYEKDQNNGSLLGKMYGDTLRGLYTFMSEGRESIREVLFLQKDSLLMEGYGSLEEKNGATVFKNPQDVKFDGIVLKKAACK
jgi:hypothetical protein